MLAAMSYSKQNFHSLSSSSSSPSSIHRATVMSRRNRRRRRVPTLSIKFPFLFLVHPFQSHLPCRERRTKTGLDACWWVKAKNKRNWSPANETTMDGWMEQGGGILSKVTRRHGVGGRYNVPNVYKTRSAMYVSENIRKWINETKKGVKKIARRWKFFKKHGGWMKNYGRRKNNWSKKRTEPGAMDCLLLLVMVGISKEILKLKIITPPTHRRRDAGEMDFSNVFERGEQLRWFCVVVQRTMFWRRWFCITKLRLQITITKTGSTKDCTNLKFKATVMSMTKKLCRLLRWKILSMRVSSIDSLPLYSHMCMQSVSKTRPLRTVRTYLT